jgi:hypothetical protein
VEGDWKGEEPLQNPGLVRGRAVHPPILDFLRTTEVGRRVEPNRAKEGRDDESEGERDEGSEREESEDPEREEGEVAALRRQEEGE